MTQDPVERAFETVIELVKMIARLEYEPRRVITAEHAPQISHLIRAIYELHENPFNSRIGISLYTALFDKLCFVSRPQNDVILSVGEVFALSLLCRKIPRNAICKRIEQGDGEEKVCY